MTERENARRNVQMYKFAMLDTNLFLDTHPQNSNAISYFKRMKQQADQAVQTYEKNFGALSSSSADGAEWSWVKGPWPWEGVK